MKREKLMNLELVAETNDGENIPEWILVEILIRLPVKLIFRLKLVSKRWLHIISHPFLARAYVRRASSFPQLQHWTFVSQYMHLDGSEISNEPLLDMYCCELENPGLYALPIPCTQQPVEQMKFKIFGVSNGLLLYGPIVLTLREGDFLASYSICNPATRQWISLPPQSSRVKQLAQEITGFLTRLESHILVSYRVVCIHLIGGSKVINLDVFVSETGKWMELGVPIDHMIRVESYKAPVVLNGILHWMTHEHGLLAYDPYHSPELFRFIALPKDRNPRFDDGRAIPSICDLHQGRLRYFEISQKNTPPSDFLGIRVWILNDYRKDGDWSLVYRVRFGDISCDGIFSDQELEPTPLSFHPFDENIVYLGYNSAILSYDFEKRKMEAHGDPSLAALVNKMINGWDPAWWWTLLFVIPPWPVSIYYGVNCCWKIGFES